VVVKKEILKVSNFDDNDNISLFTIASSETDIHLCLLINKIFKISLSLSDDLLVPAKTGPAGFRKYEFENDEAGEKFILLLNHNSSGKFLLPEFKKIDYVFLIISEMDGKAYEKRIKLLKENTALTALFKIDPATVKSFGKIKS
jgi:hypothetical protein